MHRPSRMQSPTGKNNHATIWLNHHPIRQCKSLLIRTSPVIQTGIMHTKTHQKSAISSCPCRCKLLWQVSLKTDGPNIVPPDASIFSPTESTLQTHSIYECENTRQLINFYYAVNSTWYKSIDKGYFQGWNGLTSERVCCFIKPSKYNLMGHLDQKRQGIRSTKSSTDDTTLDPMAEPPQVPCNDKTNMVFMTMVDIKAKLFTDQTGQFPVTFSRGNNYIIIFYTVDANHIKSYPFMHTARYTHTYTCKDIAHSYTN
ncbi:hypothetical protein ACHAW6_006449 [Cyclotella cf. meneghiniana]